MGPFPEVSVPGFQRKFCKQGETVSIRLPEGVSLDGSWEIVESDKPKAAKKSSKKEVTDNG